MQITKRLTFTALVALAVIAIACGSTSGSESDTGAPGNDDPPDDPSDQLDPRVLNSDWRTDFSIHSVPLGDFLSGGPRKDGIRSLENPPFISIEEGNEFFVDNEPVIAIEINGDARAYPLGILTQHEIANDVIGGVPVAVTFCPLCNSAIVFARELDGVV